MQRLLRFGGVCALLLLYAGGGESSRPALAPAEIGRLSRDGQQSLAQRRYAEAAATFLRGAECAAALGDVRRETLFLNAAAGSYFAGARYLQAGAAYRRAIERARQAGEAELRAVAHINLSSLHTALSDADSGEAELRAAEYFLPPSSVHRPRLWAQRMFVAARRGERGEARRWGAMAAEAADAAGDTALLAQIWDKLGNIALQEKSLEEADDYLCAAHRLRRLAGAGALERSYLSLSRLRRAQGRPEEALLFAELARGARPANLEAAAAWWRHYEDALTCRAAGLQREALSEARKAVAGAAEWRRWVMTTQAAQTAGDATEAEAAALLADLLLPGASQTQAAEAFLAVEASRATSLRAAAWQSGLRQGRIPDTHGDTLLALRDHEARRAAGHDVDSSAGAGLRARLAELESEAGFGAAAGLREPPTLEGLRARLAPGEAYFSFLTGEGRSWGWMLTRDTFRWGALPERRELAAGIESLRRALASDDPGWSGQARALAREWLGWAGVEASNARRWLISADDVLFAFPWSAFEPGRAFILTPVLSFREMRPPAWGAGGVAAFGDAIYNRADSRWQRPVSLLPATPGYPELEMPRLAGSGVEAGRVARAARQAGWPAAAYTGAAVNRQSIRQALRREPAVLHLAAHFFEGKPGGRFTALLNSGPAAGLARPREMFLALSLRPDGMPDLLTARGVASLLYAPDALIVLSGCGSGTGDHLPGAGVQGFTYAWLAAGARAVVASLWPVADDSGEFFDRFYARLAQRTPASDALAAARQEALNAGGWRARPSVWAGYFAMGKE